MNESNTNAEDPNGERDKPVSPENKLSFEAYYASKGGGYYIRNEASEFIQIKTNDLVKYLKQEGLSSQSSHGNLSQIDSVICQIQQRFSVDYAGELAGYDSGFHRSLGGRPVLITRSMKLIPPKEGDCEMLKGFFTGILGEVQAMYFFGWLHVTLKALHEGQFRPGQVLALVGEAGCGKTLTVKIMSKLMGGRQGHPYAFMVGKTNFNSDIFKAELSVIDDQKPSGKLSEREAFASEIKKLTVGEAQWFHAKYSEAFNAVPFTRLAMCMNPEPSNMAILPKWEKSIQEKFMLFWVEKKGLPMATVENSDRNAFWAKVDEELPAFAHFCLNYKISKGIESERFGVTHYHNPELLTKISDLDFENVLLDLIDKYIFGMSEELYWNGTAQALSATLLKFPEIKGDISVLARLENIMTVGRLLAKLTGQHSDRFVRSTSSGNVVWLIASKKL